MIKTILLIFSVFILLISTTLTVIYFFALVFKVESMMVLDFAPSGMLFSLLATCILLELERNGQ